VFVLSGQSSVGQNRRKRDLTKYDNGGAFDFRWSVTPDAHKRMASTVRDFIWQHWTNKHLGHVARTVYTIEGDPTTYHLFIEPDANQTWHVVMTYRSNCCWYYGLGKPKRKRRLETGATRFDIVERVPTAEPEVYTLRLRRAGDKNDSDAFEL
jgi:hypothetical protein